MNARKKILDFDKNYVYKIGIFMYKYLPYVSNIR